MEPKVKPSGPTKQKPDLAGRRFFTCGSASVSSGVKNYKSSGRDWKTLVGVSRSAHTMPRRSRRAQVGIQNLGRYGKKRKASKKKKM